MKVSAVTHPEPASTPLSNGTGSSPSRSQLEPEPRPPPASLTQPAKTSSQSLETPKRASLGPPQAFNRGQALQADVGAPRSPQPARPKAHSIGEGLKCGNPANTDVRKACTLEKAGNVKDFGMTNFTDI